MSSIFDRVVEMSTDTSTAKPAQLRTEADMGFEDAQRRANSAIDESHERAENIEESARQLAETTLKSNPRNSLVQKEADGILARAKASADQAIQNGQRQADIIINAGQEDSSRLRKRANDLDAAGPPRIAQKEDALAGLLRDVVQNFLFLAYFAAVGNRLGIRGLSFRGLLGACLVVLLISVGNAFSGTKGIFDAFGFLLLASALFAAQTKDISAGEVAISSVYLVCRRLGTALVIMVAACFSAVFVTVASLFLFLGTETLQDFQDAISGTNPIEISSTIGSTSYFVVVGVAVCLLAAMFLFNFFSALGGGAFLSILQGPATADATAVGSLEPTLPFEEE